MKTKPLNADDIFALQSEFCSIFQNAKRLKILWRLGESEMTVTRIAGEAGISLSNASQHLRVMKDRRIITSRKEGQRIFYRITNGKFIQGSELIRQGVAEEYDLDPDEVRKALSGRAEISP